MEFKSFPKIARFNREVIVTEKIDGTNAQIYIGENGEFLTGSRSRWITPQDDNFGFSKWANENKEELLQLGVGTHFGEWWGYGIQRGYGMTEKVFSLFNTIRWKDNHPACCRVVPILWAGKFIELNLEKVMNELKNSGSLASPGFMRPEGVVIYHTAGNFCLKRTFIKDDEWKGK